jgi:hypothetical protein
MTQTCSRRAFFAFAGGAVLAGTAALASPRWAFAAGTPAAGAPIASSSSQPLLRIDLVGGFVAPIVNVTRLPLVAIYADGTVISTGPMIDIYPAPALPNLRELTLTPAGLDHMVALAKAAGLGEDKRYSGGIVTDMPDTVFTFVDHGTTIAVAAYALGFDEGEIADPAVRAARAKLLALQSKLTNLANTLPPDELAAGDRPYEIERIRVYAQPIDPANPPAADLPQQPMEWPLAIDLATFGETGNSAFAGDETRCGLVEGVDARTLVAALKQANQLTPWVSNGTEYQIWVRPLLPDEPSAVGRQPSAFSTQSSDLSPPVLLTPDG